MGPQGSAASSHVIPGEGLLCGCSQTLELPPTGGQPGPIFAVLPQAAKDLFLQAGFSLVTGCLSRVC